MVGAYLVKSFSLIGTAWFCFLKNRLKAKKKSIRLVAFRVKTIRDKRDT